MERENKKRPPTFLKPRVLEPVTPMYSHQVKKIPETPILSGALSNYAKEWEDINTARVPIKVISEEAKRLIDLALSLNKKEIMKISCVDVFQDRRTKYIYKLSQDCRVAQITVRSKLSNDSAQSGVLSFDTLEKVLELMKKRERQPEVVGRTVFETSTIREAKKLPDFLAKIVEKSKMEFSPTIDTNNKSKGEEKSVCRMEKEANEGGLFGYRTELPLLSRVKQEATFDYDEDASQNEDEEEEEDVKLKGKKKSKTTD